MGMSLTQRRALAINPKVTGYLSVICSGIVVYSVMRDPRKRARIYHRLLLGISIMDMTLSFGLGLSTTPIPADSGALYAVGNVQTCELQGFMIQTGIAAGLYNGILALYYLLSLKHNWTERQLQRYEPLMHAVPLMFAFGTAIMGIPLRLYNNANLWCWIAPYPSKCIDHSDCIRGAHASNYRWAFYYGPLWLMILFVTYVQVKIFLHIRKILDARIRKEQSELQNRTSTISCSEAEDSAAVVDDDEEDELNMKEEDLDRVTKLTKRRLREIALQCFMYAVSFYINWSAVTAVRILQAQNKTAPYGLLLTAATLTPFQGMPNLLIYIFPKFLHERRTYPHAGFFTWIKNSI